MKKNLTLDAVLWVTVMMAAAVIAFGLLQRDSRRNFGAVSFGAFPQFHHLLKGHVWAVHAGSSAAGLISMADRLTAIQQRTAAGKRHLYILTLSDGPSPALKPRTPFHYIAVGHGPSLFAGFGKASEDTVLLVDQNAIVRGKYNISDVQEFREFQQDLLHIL